MSETPVPAELRALYDIRVKEVHHYNTVIWAFPAAFVAIIATEFRFLEDDIPALLTAAIFNFALFYVFHRHLKNHKSVCDCLSFTEGKIRELYGSEYVPTFTAPRIRATKVMRVSLFILCVLFTLHVFQPLLRWMKPGDIFF